LLAEAARNYRRRGECSLVDPVVGYRMSLS
jgi:hypothetical protein